MHKNKGEHLSVDWSAKGVYSARLYTKSAVEQINRHNISKPLFLYLAYSVAHNLIEAPRQSVKKFSYIEDDKHNIEGGRRKYAGKTKLAAYSGKSVNISSLWYNLKNY